MYYIRLFVLGILEVYGINIFIVFLILIIFFLLMGKG